MRHKPKCRQFPLPTKQLCYQCRLEILPYQDRICRSNKRGDDILPLHSGCIPDFEAGSPVGTMPLAEKWIEESLLALLRGRKP